jgi:hypothetical protein
VVGRAAFGGFDVRGVVPRKCALAGGLEKRGITASRLTLENDGVKVGDVLRLLDPDDGSKCRLL